MMNSHELPDQPKLPQRVLVVDDHPTNRKLLSAMLLAEGMTVRESADGLDALAVLEREQVDAVITDILMPNMDGYQLCREIRRSEKLRRLPLVVYTNTYTSPSDRELALNFGADDYLTKPASPGDVCAALRRVCFRSGREPDAGLPDQNTEFVMKKYANVLISKLEKKNHELEDARSELERMNRELDRRVQKRTAQLEAANAELDSFCHSVSHDLRAPLRCISGFARMLDEKFEDALAGDGRRYLENILQSSERMGDLIEDLLGLSRVGRQRLSVESVDLAATSRRVVDGLRSGSPDRNVEVAVDNRFMVEADPKLLLIVLENLLGNAWKFTSNQTDARIEVGGTTDDRGRRICFVRDNGAGFDMDHAERLFAPFQRLHRQDEYAGTGVGLATVKRIIDRHGGRIWAEASPGKGAAFNFTTEPDADVVPDQKTEGPERIDFGGHSFANQRTG